MRLLKPALGLFLPLVGILLILRFSSISSTERPRENEGDWIAEVYALFDTLRTDPDAYRWPTDATSIISSAFGEFRRTHFHAGIDISTKGQQGYRVFASRDGYVSRLSVSPTGYGIFLDLRHPDGFTTRYAHLQRFNDSLEAFIRRKQQEVTRYEISVSLDSSAFPVHAGEVIAYSGETGIGAPHLHFEVRDERMNPLNPLRLNAFRAIVRDDLDPVIRSVAFEPMDYRSTVNGGHRPVFIAAARGKDGRYRMSRPVRASGRIGLSVRISDPFSGTWHKSGPYRLALSVDDSLTFQARLDQVDASQSEQVALHYNWPALSRGRYLNLYVKTGNRMPFYDQLPEEAGVLSYEQLAPGPHRIEIVALDFHGNESRLLADLDFGSPNSGRVETARNSGVRPLPEDLPGSARGTSHGTSDPSDEPPKSDREERETLRSVLWSPEVSEQTKLLEIEKEFYPNYVLITLTTSGTYTLRPSLWVSSGEHRQLVDIDAVDSRRYAGVFPLDRIQGDRLRIEAYAEIDGKPVTARNDFSVAVVEPGYTTLLRSPDGTFSATFGKEAVYEPLYVRMEQRESGYALEPRTILLKRGADISLTVAQADPDGKLGLYFGEEWDMDFTGQRDTALSTTTFRTRLTRMLGTISVHRDSVPPTITRVSVRPSRRTVRVDFRVWDDLSGVRSDEISVRLDGQPLIPVYDPYSRSVSAEGPIPSGFSEHAVSIRVEDRSSNTNEITRTFVKRIP